MRGNIKELQPRRSFWRIISFV